MIEDLLANGIWVAIIFIIVGFVALVKGADCLVDGASSIAKRFGISDLVIGLTVVAFGTSMPEFVVNMVSVGEGSTDLAITNILGSNIINTLVILGVTALIFPIASQKHSRNFDIPMSIFAGIFVLGAILIHAPFLSSADGGIGRLGGILLLLFFIYFLYETFRHAKDHPDEAETVKTMSTGKAILFLLLGLAGLVIGGELIVKSAVDIASRCGVSQAIIGLTVVALGTSLPELATSIIAAYKHNSDIALGNVIGSNIFNVFFVLGASATIRPLPTYDGIALDACVAALGSIVVWIAVKTDKGHKINRWAGAVLLLIYGGYLTYRLLNV
jgi:cation:H+ antiporter